MGVQILSLERIKLYSLVCLKLKEDCQQRQVQWLESVRQPVEEAHEHQIQRGGQTLTEEKLLGQMHWVKVVARFLEMNGKKKRKITTEKENNYS